MTDITRRSRIQGHRRRILEADQPTAGERHRRRFAAKASVLVNGKSVAFEAYNIDGSNFFKLRDIAMALSGSAKHSHKAMTRPKSPSP